MRMTIRIRTVKMIPVNAFENEVLTLARIYANAESLALEKVAKRVAKGIDKPNYAAFKSNELRMLREELTPEIKALTKRIPKEVETVVEAAYREGQASATRDIERANKLRRAGESPIQKGFSVTDQYKVRAIANELSDKLTSTHFRILRQAQDAYMTCVTNAVSVAQTGVITRREAAQLSLNQFADRGITGFVDKSGRSWSLQSYTEMATRTSYRQASLEGNFQRMIENGYDLVMVDAHVGSCERCAPWNGRIISLSGRDSKYPSLADATADGLFHPNCKHSFSAYFPGLSKKSEFKESEHDRKSRYDETLKQRKIERDIRHWKKRETVAITDSEKEKCKFKIREKQANMRAFIDSTGRQRKPVREQIKRAI